MTKEIDTGLEGLAEAYVNAKKWSEKNNRSAVHIIKTHYKDLVDKQEKELERKLKNDRFRKTTKTK